MPLLLLLACHPAVDCVAEPPAAGTIARCAVGEDRSYLARLPAEAGGPLPVVVAFHGGGGNAEGMVGQTCPDADADDPACLHALGDREGFAVVWAEGTGPALLARFKTWNAGGGVHDWQCVSGGACRDGVDDVAYVEAVLDDLARWAPIDPARVYATGMSNGAAMSYRLACALPERFAAIAPVAGADQWGAAQGCPSDAPVAVLHVHGTEDPCWAYEGGDAACAQDDGGAKASVEDSLARWATRNGCVGEPTVEALPDLADDGTTVERVRWSGCVAPVEHLRVLGGGHTWPDGDAYLPERRIGPVSRDVNANAELWAFFAATSG